MFDFNNIDYDKLTYEERLNHYIDRQEQDKQLINDVINQL